jgi:hypothetical protein
MKHYKHYEVLNLKCLNSIILYATQFLGNCVAAKSRSVPPALAKAVFFARYAEARTEAKDAFTVPDSGCSECSSCRRLHREVLFAYPPSALINRFLAKARARRCQGSSGSPNLGQCSLLEQVPARFSPESSVRLCCRSALSASGPGH